MRQEEVKKVIHRMRSKALAESSLKFPEASSKIDASRLSQQIGEKMANNGANKNIQYCNYIRNANMLDRRLFLRCLRKRVREANKET